MLSVRPLKPEEWEGYKALRLEALKEEPQAFCSLYADFVDRPDAYWQQRLSEATGSGESWLRFAFDDGSLIGMIGASLAEGGSVVEIYSVYVTKKARGRGVGKKLLQSVFEIVEGNRQVAEARLDVKRSQSAAIALYESLGFKTVSAEEGSDVVTMKKALRDTVTAAPMPTLETPRLILRPMRETDADRIQLLFPQWDVVRYLAKTVPWPYPDDGAAEFLKLLLPKIERGEEYQWAILLKENPSLGLIGSIGLMPINEIDNRGFWLGQDYWRKGYMREATEAVTDFAFDKVGMRALKLSNAQPNTGSHRLKEAAGAEIVEIEEGGEFVSGRFPTVRWLLTVENWRRRHQSSEN